MAGFRALLARATTRVRAPTGVRTTTEIAGWRALLARTRARFRSTADAGEVVDAAGGPKTSAASRRIKNMDQGKCKEMSPKAKTNLSPSKSQIKDQQKCKETSPQKMNDKSKGKPVSPIAKPNPSPSKAKRRLMDPQTVAAPPRPMGTFEKFVVKVEHNVDLAVRLSIALKDAGKAFTNAMQAAGALVLGSSLLLYHKDRFFENCRKVKDLFPSSARTTPGSSADAAPASPSDTASASSTSTASASSSVPAPSADSPSS